MCRFNLYICVDVQYGEPRWFLSAMMATSLVACSQHKVPVPTWITLFPWVASRVVKETRFQNIRHHKTIFIRLPTP